MAIKSMTGYGSEITRDGYMVEIRSLNGRFLDINIKMPQEFYPYEANIRKIIKNYFVRGSIELIISKKQIDNPVCIPRLNRPYAMHYINILKEISNLSGGSVDYSALLQIKDIVFIDVDESGMKDILKNITDTLENVCLMVSEMRKIEGNALVRSLIDGINALKSNCGRISEYSDMQNEIIRENLKKKIGELINDPSFDRNRFEEEILYYVNRMDILEEIERLKSHINQFEELLNEEGEVGRRLDFICQEILRELNTIGSKSTIIGIKKLIISSKDIIEKLREQVQNIE